MGWRPVRAVMTQCGAAAESASVSASVSAIAIAIAIVSFAMRVAEWLR